MKNAVSPALYLLPIILLASVITFFSVYTIDDSIKKSEITSSSPIIIGTNAGFAEYASSGDGSAGNPWLIKDKTIVLVSSSDVGVWISLTTDYFILRNINVIMATGVTGGTGFRIASASNGKMELCVATQSNTGMTVQTCENFRFNDCVLSSASSYGAKVEFSNNVHFIDCEMGGTIQFFSIHELTVKKCFLYGTVFVNVENNGDNVAFHGNDWNVYRVQFSKGSSVVSNVTFINNTMWSNTGISLQFTNYQNLVVENNTITALTAAGSTYGAIDLDTVTSSTFKNNTMIGTLYGFKIKNSGDCMFLRNNFTTNFISSTTAINIDATSDDLYFYNNAFSHKRGSTHTYAITTMIDTGTVVFCNNTFHDGVTVTDPGLSSWSENGYGNLWWDYKAKHPGATNDGITWNEWYAIDMANSVGDADALVNQTITALPFISPVSAIFYKDPLNVTIEIVSDSMNPRVEYFTYQISNDTWTSPVHALEKQLDPLRYTDSRTYKLSDCLYTITSSLKIKFVDTVYTETTTFFSSVASIIITNPASDTVFTSPILITAICNDGTGVNVWYRVRGTEASDNFTMSPTAVPDEYTALFDPASFDHIASENWIDVFLKNDLDVEIKESVRFYYDKDPSSITIVSPYNGEILGSTDVLVEAECSDVDGIASVIATIIHEGNPFAGELSYDGVSGYYTGIISISGVTFASVGKLTIAVVDDNGFSTTSPIRTFTMDVTDPTIVTMTPEGTIFTSITIPVYAGVQDETPVVSVVATISGHGTLATVELTKINMHEFEGSFTWNDEMVDGDYSLEMVATDSAKHTRTKSVSVIIDMLGPTLAIIEPVNGTIFTSEQIGGIPVVVNILDNVPVEATFTVFDAGMNVIQSATNLVFSDGMYRATISKTIFIVPIHDPIQQFFVRVEAESFTGKVANKDDATFIYQIILPPIIFTGISPANGTSINKVQTTNLKVSANVTGVALDLVVIVSNATWSSSSIPMNMIASGQYSVEIDVSVFVDGNYTVTIVADDGTKTRTATISITITSPEQTIWDMIVAFFYSIIVFILGLLGIAVVIMRPKKSRLQMTGEDCHEIDGKCTV